MTNTGRHCPFLNREDPRCASHFQVNQLGYAFAHCFSDYATCPTYRELLTHRQANRRSARAGTHETVTVDISVRGTRVSQPADSNTHRQPVVA